MEPPGRRQRGRFMDLVREDKQIGVKKRKGRDGR